MSDDSKVRTKMVKRATVVVTLRLSSVRLGTLMGAIYRLSMKQASAGRGEDHVELGAFWDDLDVARREMRDE